MNKKLKKATLGYFFTALGCSLLFPVGIVLIPVCISREQTAGMIVGIAITAICFYATPFLWLGFSSQRSMAHLILSITEQRIRTVPELEAALGWSNGVIVRMIRSALGKGYLPGLLFDGTCLKSIRQEEPAPEHRVHYVICPSCGANNEFEGESSRCQWCGTPLHTKDGE